MTMFQSRAGRFGLAFVAAAGLIGVSAAPALAQGGQANSSAYGVSASGLVNVAPTPTSTCPPGGTSDTIDVDLQQLGSVKAVSASTQCDPDAGTSSATAQTAGVALLTPTAVALPLLSATAVTATCSANGLPGGLTGSTNLASAKLGSLINLAVNPAPNTGVNLQGIASVILNEQTTSGGVLTVNAIHITVLPNLNGTQAGEDIIIGHVTCGPNAAPYDAFSFANTPVILGGIAVLIALVFGIRFGVRRLSARA